MNLLSRSTRTAVVLVASLTCVAGAKAQTVNLHQYFPGLKQGNSWQYTVDVRLAPSDPFATIAATIATGTPASIHGVQATPLTFMSTFPGDVGSSRSYSIDANGLHQHREDFDLTSADFETYPTPADLAPAQITVGQSYPFSFTFNGQSPADNDTWSGSTNGSIQIIGFENVTAPAGSFNALRLDFNTTWSETGIENGQAYSGNGGVDETWWLVDGLGIVRQDSLKTDSYGEDDSYVEFSARLTSSIVLDPADLDGDGDVDDADFGQAFAAFTGPNIGPSSNPAADLDNDGDVDDADFGQAFAAFTGPGGSAGVPEPASAVLLGAAGLVFARRRSR